MHGFSGADAECAMLAVIREGDICRVIAPDGALARAAVEKTSPALAKLEPGTLLRVLETASLGSLPSSSSSTGGGSLAIPRLRFQEICVEHPPRQSVNRNNNGSVCGGTSSGAATGAVRGWVSARNEDGIPLVELERVCSQYGQTIGCDLPRNSKARNMHGGAAEVVGAPCVAGGADASSSRSSVPPSGAEGGTHHRIRERLNGHQQQVEAEAQQLCGPNYLSGACGYNRPCAHQICR